MTLFSRRSLRVQLIAILALALTPLLLLSILQGAAEYQDRRDQLVERQRAAGNLAALELSDGIERALGLAAAIEEGMFERRGDDGGCPRALDRIAAPDPAIANIAILDAGGAVICSASPQRGPALAAEEAWFDRLRSGSETAVGHVLDGGSSRPPVLIAARRLDNGRLFSGAVIVSIDIQQTTEQLRADLLPSGSVLALWDRGGVYELNPGNPVRLDFERLPVGLIDRVVDLGEPLLIESADFAGGSRALVSPLVNGHIGTLVLTPSDPPFTLVTGFDLVGTVLIPLLMWLLAIMCVWIAIDRFVLRWLTYLRRIARLYGDGRLDIDPSRARSAPTEVEELASALAKMAGSLREQHGELEQAIDQRTALLREIHHRVKNNLQVIVSLLNLQAGRLPEGPGRLALFEARRRINALALVHRSLYEAEDLREVEMRSFLSDLISYVAEASQSAEQTVGIESDSAEIALEPDYAVPMALFVTEAVNNAFKHAFLEGKEGRIKVTLSEREGGGESGQALEIAVEDDGSGIREDVAPGTGSTLMRAFAQQLGGELETGTSEIGGTRIAIKFTYRPRHDEPLLPV